MKRLLTSVLNRIMKEWFLLVMLTTITFILYVASLF